MGRFTFLSYRRFLAASMYCRATVTETGLRIRVLFPSFALKMSGVPAPMQISVSDVADVFRCGLLKRHVLLLPAATSPHPPFQMSARAARLFLGDRVSDAKSISLFKAYDTVRSVKTPGRRSWLP